MSSIISICDLTKEFGDRIILDSINMEVRTGSRHGLLGLNGIGKTTLIKILTGLSSRTSGSCKIAGMEVKDVKDLFVYLPENFTPPMFMTGAEFLRFSSNLYGMEYEHGTSVTLAEELEFDSAKLHHLISSYSKGMKQKLALISVFSMKNKLFILDEPMSGLDPLARRLLKKRLKKLEGTLFFSSHILSDVAEICDIVSIMHVGRVLLTDTPQNVIKQTKKKNLEDAFLNVIGIL